MILITVYRYCEEKIDVGYYGVTNFNFLLILSMHNQDKWLWEFKERAAKGKMLWSFIKFSHQILKGNVHVWTLVWTIWVGYLGWEGLRVKKKSGGDIDLWWTINCSAS